MACLSLSDRISLSFSLSHPPSSSTEKIEYIFLRKNIILNSHRRVRKRFFFPPLFFRLVVGHETFPCVCVNGCSYPATHIELTTTTTTYFEQRQHDDIITPPKRAEVFWNRNHSSPRFIFPFFFFSASFFLSLSSWGAIKKQGPRTCLSFQHSAF